MTTQPPSETPQGARLLTLKPCPFCDGEDAELAKSHVPTKMAVYCNDCFCEGPTDVNGEAAIDAWNARPLTAKLAEAEARVAALEHALSEVLEGIEICTPDAPVPVPGSIIHAARAILTK